MLGRKPVWNMENVIWWTLAGNEFVIKKMLHGGQLQAMLWNMENVTGLTWQTVSSEYGKCYNNNTSNGNSTSSGKR